MIRSAAREVGVELTEEQEQRLVMFCDVLERWNKRIRLVGDASRAVVATRHIADSLTVLEDVPQGARLVDVGAGGGFPSVVIATIRGDVSVTALEPIQKKCAFLKTAARELELANYRALPERDDQHRERDDFVPYDVATSRATFALPEWLEAGRLFVRPGGLVIGMEGSRQEELPNGATRRSIAVGDRSRSIVVLVTESDRAS